MINTEFFKNKLKEEEGTLISELNSIGVKNKDLENDWQVTPAEREQQIESQDEIADRMEDIEEREATEVALETRLKEIRHALEKIDQGKYGICEISGEEIEEDRLKANPAARTCKKHLDEEGNLPLITS